MSIIADKCFPARCKHVKYNNYNLQILFHRVYFNGQLCQSSAVVKCKLQLKKVNCAVVVVVLAGWKRRLCVNDSNKSSRNFEWNYKKILEIKYLSADYLVLCSYRLCFKSLCPGVSGLALDCWICDSSQGMNYCTGLGESKTFWGEAVCCTVTQALRKNRNDGKTLILSLHFS